MVDFTLPQQGMDGDSSVVVAPLNIQKSTNKSPIEAFSHSRQSSSKGSHSVRSHSQSQPSPPLTPRSSQEGMNSHTPPQPVFHNYLRAFYHYTPSSITSTSSDESSITVAIKQGDVILVHSVHPNGWADGTLLASGARGWLPTNYCEPYDHPTIRNLLNALTNLWDLVRDGENGNVTAFTKQDYVRGMIAGIRFFLERTGCLSRDSRMIVAHVGLRRMRKGLLGDLSSLVKTAKKFQEFLQLDHALLPIFDHMDELVLKSFKLVTRAVRFLDIWATDAVSLSSFDIGDVNIQRPLTPPSESIDAAVQPQETSHREPEDDLSTNSCGSPVPQGPLSSREDWSTSTNQPPRKFNRVSVAFSLPSDSDSLQSPVFFTPPQTHVRHVKRISLTHRLSYTGKSSSTHHEDLVSERLNATHDAFLGFIASFIGLHLQSRSSEELAEITEQSVIACQQLLIVVTEVWERDSRRSQPLKEARENMYARLSELVQATKVMFSLTDAEVNAELAADSGKQLVAAATSCVRSAGDCVTKARIVVETVGDFEFEATGLGLTDTAFQQLHPLRNRSDSKAEVSWPLESSPKFQRPLHARPALKHPIPPPLILPDSQRLLEAPETSPLILQIPSAPLTTTDSPVALSFRSSISSLPIQGAVISPLLTPPSSVESLASPIATTSDVPLSPTKPNSSNMLATDMGPTHNFSMPGGPGSVMSHPSTRAATPDHFPSRKPSSQTLMSSFGSSSELRSLASDDVSAGEEHLLETTYVHELIYNKEGQISGGSLPALVEQLTTYESTPDAVFVTAFYLTFRLFTTPIELAQCLIDRFDYIGSSSAVGVPVRLRVYNVFKGWLESHWSGESDSVALSLIRTFATGRLAAAMPSAGKRLAELTSKVTEVRAGALVPRLVSSIGKTGISNVVFTPADTNVPSSNITKSQLNALRASKEGKSQCSILDFDPLELARQFTIIESKLFCAIQPEELLALEWTKKSDSKAHNVKAMSTLSTDLANLVADTILHLEDAKKRATIIKQWVKIAMKCLELNNYDSLMAIICSLNSSMVMRLKKTWELVSTKTKARLEELKAITDVGRNYAVLRQRLHNHVAPCLPFVGIYLTDLTFVDVGNGTTRQLPGESGSNSVSVINFDKHMKTAKIIGQLQSFQVPYRLAAIPEMQDWMETQIQRVRSSDEANVQSYYRRSLLLEPREAQSFNKHSPSIDNGVFSAESRNTSRDKFEFLNFNFSTSNTKG